MKIGVDLSKNKLMFVDETLIKPDISTSEGHAWERCNSMVIAWLHNVIAKSLHGSVAYAETAEELWSNLKDRYSQRNDIRIHQLKREITLANQAMKSYGRVMALLPSCKCTKKFNLNKHFEGD